MIWKATAPHITGAPAITIDATMDAHGTTGATTRALVPGRPEVPGAQAARDAGADPTMMPVAISLAPTSPGLVRSQLVRRPEHGALWRAWGHCSPRQACRLLANVVVKAAKLTKAEKEEIF